MVTVIDKRRRKKKRSVRPNPKSTPKEIAGSHGHRPHGPSILWPALYEHLRRKGKTKAAAAAISNAGWKKKRMGIPTNTPLSLRGIAKAGKGCRRYKKGKNGMCRNCRMSAAAHDVVKSGPEEGAYDNPVGDDRKKGKKTDKKKKKPMDPWTEAGIVNPQSPALASKLGVASASDLKDGVEKTVVKKSEPVEKVRRVRTPAGVRRFGVPIGTPIKAGKGTKAAVRALRTVDSDKSMKPGKTPKKGGKKTPGVDGNMPGTSARSRAAARSRYNLRPSRGGGKGRTAAVERLAQQGKPGVGRKKTKTRRAGVDQDPSVRPGRTKSKGGKPTPGVDGDAPLTKAKADILAKVGEAHHKYETEDLKGVRDEQWAEWYAEKALEAGIADDWQTKPSVEQLAASMRQITDEQAEADDDDPWKDLPWNEYMARDLQSQYKKVGGSGKEPELAGEGGDDELHGVGVSDKMAVADKPGETEAEKNDRIFTTDRETYDPIDKCHQAAQTFRQEHGLPEPDYGEDGLLGIPTTPERAHAVASYFLNRPFESLSEDEQREVREAYDDLVRQVQEQMKALEASGCKVEYLTKEQIIERGLDPDGENPYPTAQDQARDIRENNRLMIASLVSWPGSYHPILDSTQGGAYDQFRAVHDFFGHAGVGTGFDRHGEFEAWLEHLSMFTGKGRLAASSELHGENSTLVVTGKSAPHNAVLLPEEVANPFDSDGKFKGTEWRDNLSLLGVDPSAEDAIGKGEVIKFDEEQQIVYGWAYVAKDAKGRVVVDKSGEYMDSPEDLENMAYGFVMKSRKGDSDHDMITKSHLVESVVFTPEKIKKMGIPDGTVPMGWWVGFKVEDAEVWKGVKSGKYGSFSIYGKGKRMKTDQDPRLATVG